MGVHAQILYANVMGFAGQGRGEANSAALPPLDIALRNVTTEIFNDAMGEMQAESGDRLLPMAMLPWWDIDKSVAEAERCLAMGMRGININSDPHVNGMPDLSEAYWYPLWELCEDKGLPVNFHIGASDASMSWYGDSPWPSFEPASKLAALRAVFEIHKLPLPDGWLRLDEGAAYRELARAATSSNRRGKIVEVGCWLGRSSSYVAAGVAISWILGESAERVEAPE